MILNPWQPMNREGDPRPRSQFKIKNYGQNGIAEIELLEEIGYWGITASDFCQQLAMVHAPQINLYVNSPGGDVYDGIAIYQALVRHPANVTAFVDGIAASAASFIVMAADEIEISPFGTMMIHDAHGLCIGNAADMTEFAAQLDAASSNIANVYAMRTGQSADTWRSAMQEEGWYYGQGAVDVGLADRVGPAKEGATAEGVDKDIAARWNLDRMFSHTPDRLRMKIEQPDLGNIPLPPVRKGQPVVEEPPVIEEPPIVASVEEEVDSPVTGDDAENDARVTSDLTAGSDNSGTVKDEPEEIEPALDFESIRAVMRGAHKNG